MGRSIQKKWFGLPIGPGSGHITVNGVKFADGTTATSAYIVKQTGSAAYIVQDAAKLHAPEIVFMVNATSVSALLPGQCYILTTPFGGSAVPCYKIAQFRVDVFENNTINSYSWSTQPAVAYGQADLIATGAAGEIVSVNITNGGRGYITVPSVSFTGGGSGATATAVLSGGVVSAINVTAPGSGYASGTMTIAAPAAAVTATAGTAVLSSGVITSVPVSIGGHYYTTAPTVTVSDSTGSGAIVIANVTNGVITSFTVSNGGTLYTSPTVTVAAPPANVQATASAIVS